MDNWETQGTPTQIGSQNDYHQGLDMFSSFIFLFLIVMVSVVIFSLTKKPLLPVIIFLVLFTALCVAAG